MFAGFSRWVLAFRKGGSTAYFHTFHCFVSIPPLSFFSIWGISPVGVIHVKVTTYRALREEWNAIAAAFGDVVVSGGALDSESDADGEDDDGRCWSDADAWSGGTGEDLEEIVDGYSSDVENFRLRLEGKEDRITTAEYLYGEIDNARFSVSLSSNNAVVCVYRKDSQKNAMRGEYQSGYLSDPFPFVTINGPFPRFAFVLQQGRRGVRRMFYNTIYALRNNGFAQTRIPEGSPIYK